ncbi:hypothetical protein [Alloalcanivorax mobilis]|uniref:hypothetical protein n=1 Tax=Alloalcanivorax mobilis TaxID=2019569 RepID=UPI000C757070|nr:hypothetical protein [Alloalcanivorax mobilis]
MGNVQIINPNSAVKNTTGDEGYLWGPYLDFFLLGGGSLFVLVPVVFLWSGDRDMASLGALFLLLANFVNNPHFAHSYQIFYKDFGGRAFGALFPASLRARYIFSAILVPAILLCFFAYVYFQSDVLALGYGANLMLFLVGWHYVKQGYGMLQVDAALKKNFFNDKEKKILVGNAYIVWVTSWVLANHLFHENQIWGISYYAFDIPYWILWALGAVSSLGAIIVTPILFGKVVAQEKGASLLNGSVAYVVSLYVWLLVRHPAMLLVIPAFHSLQYMAVVWRYRLNVEKKRSDQSLIFSRSYSVRMRLSMFFAIAVILGYLMFWGLPLFFYEFFDYDQSVFGSSLFLYFFLIFVNVHHYFMDSVIWRKGNPDTGKYLFG